MIREIDPHLDSMDTDVSDCVQHEGYVVRNDAVFRGEASLGYLFRALSEIWGEADTSESLNVEYAVDSPKMSHSVHDDFARPRMLIDILGGKRLRIECSEDPDTVFLFFEGKEFCISRTRSADRIVDWLRPLLRQGEPSIYSAVIED